MLEVVVTISKALSNAFGREEVVLYKATLKLVL